MRDRFKGNFFVYGFLCGILISGIFLLGISYAARINRQSALPLSTFPAIVISPSSIESEEGKININTATKEDLITLPGIGESKASSILEFREKYGKFEDVSELSYVPGIGKKLLESINDYISVQ